MKVGRGTEDGVEVGPLIDATQRGKVAELVDDATDRGARVLTGGAAVDRPGYFYEATVIADVPDGARVLSEEIFDPSPRSGPSTPRTRRSPPQTTPNSGWWPTCSPAT